MTPSQKRQALMMALLFGLLPSLLVCCTRFIHRRDEQLNRQYISALAHAPTIRVAIAVKQPQPEVGSDLPVVIKDEDGQIITKLPRLKASSWQVLSSGALKISGRTVSSSPILYIDPEAQYDGGLTWKGRHYSGRFVLYREGGKFTVVNVINMEQYIAGLLPHETAPEFHLEAIKAQAVTARSYAFWRARVKPRDEGRYDLLSSDHDQVYGGRDGIKSQHKEAVISTHGQILSYNSRFFKVFYHATCGGRTSSMKNSFDMTSIAPLGGVYCGYCNRSRYYRWHHNIKKEELITALQESGLKLKDVQSIKADKPGAGGHCAWLIIKDDQGKEHRLKSSVFRGKIGTRHLRSSSFDAKIEGPKVLFKGRGWGHGVGMCQWGAQGMAQQGHTYRFILRNYYPGATLRNIYRDQASPLTDRNQSLSPAS